MADIFGGSTLSELTQWQGSALDSLLGNDKSYRERLVQMATDQCTVEREMIQDIYPCTPFQENTMAFTMRKQCLFVARAYYTLPIDVGIESVESDAKDVPQVLSEGQMRDILTRGGCILEQVLP